MTRVGLLIATVITTGMPTAVHACGACVEDKVAATYDHVVIHGDREAPAGYIRRR
jgi:hypothetical protein